MEKESRSNVIWLEGGRFSVLGNFPARKKDPDARYECALLFETKVIFPFLGKTVSESEDVWIKAVRYLNWKKMEGVDKGTAISFEKVKNEFLFSMFYREGRRLSLDGLFFLNKFCEVDFLLHYHLKPDFSYVPSERKPDWIDFKNFRADSWNVDAFWSEDSDSEDPE